MGRTQSRVVAQGRPSHRSRHRRHAVARQPSPARLVADVASRLVPAPVPSARLPAAVLADMRMLTAQLSAASVQRRAVLAVVSSLGHRVVADLFSAAGNRAIGRRTFVRARNDLELAHLGVEMRRTLYTRLKVPVPVIHAAVQFMLERVDPLSWGSSIVEVDGTLHMVPMLGARSGARRSCSTTSSVSAATRTARDADWGPGRAAAHTSARTAFLALASRITSRDPQHLTALNSELQT